MDRNRILNRIAHAEWRISEGTFHVERQQRLAQELADDGEDETQAVALLKTFEDSLMLLIEDCDRLREGLKTKGRPGPG